MIRPTLLAVTGPTATGKTSLAVAIAKHFNTVVINADSRQFYKEMTIGTAKPTMEQMQGVPHFFTDFLSITENYTVGDFEKQSIETVEGLFKINPVVVVCGGSGLFVKALCEGLGEAPATDLIVRQKWQDLLDKKGLTYLQTEAQKRDPEWFSTADILNPRRLQRALEIMDITDEKMSAIQKKSITQRLFNTIYIGLTDKKREALYARINKRVDSMIEAGLEEEVTHLLKYKQYAAFNTIGYKEWLPYFEKKRTVAEVADDIKQNTRHFAKRQMTWFNKVENMKWFEHRDYDSIMLYINGLLSV